MKVSSEVFFKAVRPTIEPYGLQINELDKLAVYVKAFELSLHRHFNSGYQIEQVLSAVSEMAKSPRISVQSLDPELKSMLKSNSHRDNCRTILTSIVDDTNQSASTYIYIQNQLQQLTC
mgnify:CR=1 FL=1